MAKGKSKRAAKQRVELRASQVPAEAEAEITNVFFEQRQTVVPRQVITAVRAACGVWQGWFAGLDGDEAFDAATLGSVGYALGMYGAATLAIGIDTMTGVERFLPLRVWPTGDGTTYSGTTMPLDARQPMPVRVSEDSVIRVALPHSKPPFAFGDSAADGLSMLETSLKRESAVLPTHFIETDERLIGMGKDARADIERSMITARADRNAGHAPVLAAGLKPSETRFGPKPTEAAIKMRQDYTLDVEAAYGIVGLLRQGASTESQMLWRAAVIRTALPLIKMLEQEASAKLERDVEFRKDNLTLATFADRVRGVRQLTDAGVEVNRALALAGVE